MLFWKFLEVTDLISLQNQASGHTFSSCESKVDYTVVHRPTLAYHLFLSTNAHSLHFVNGYFLAIRAELSNCDRCCRPKIFTVAFTENICQSCSKKSKNTKTENSTKILSISFLQGRVFLKNNWPKDVRIFFSMVP